MNDITYSSFRFDHYHSLMLIMCFVVGNNHTNVRALYASHTSSGTSVVGLNNRIMEVMRMKEVCVGCGGLAMG